MKRIAADSTASLHYYFKYLLVVVIFRNEVNCRGGEEEKLIWPGEEEASTVPHKYTDFIKMMNSAKATPTGGQKYQNISIFETENFISICSHQIIFKIA